MIKIDIERAIVTVENGEEVRSYPLATREAFAIVSDAWLRCGWDTKYVYSFAWLGRPIIQLPDDMVRAQEAIFAIKPDVIIETGVAHGGSLVFYAGLCRLIGHGRVIGIDIDIRPHNRKAIEAHFLYDLITLIEGSSVSSEIVEQVRTQLKPGHKVLVFLDSNHSKAHVLDELRAYGELVSVGSYIVATDGIMEKLVGAPRSQPDWASNNPKTAAEQFVREDRRFVIEAPRPVFNEGLIEQGPTYWPGAWVKRIA